MIFCKKSPNTDLCTGMSQKRYWSLHTIHDKDKMNQVFEMNGKETKV